MKHILLSLALLMTILNVSQAQSTQTPIQLKKSFGSHTYTTDNKTLSLSEASIAFSTNELARQEFKKSQGANTWATILGGVGGGLIGWPAGTALGGGEANWALAGIGAGLVAISIPFTIKSTKKAQRAVDLYNAHAAGAFVKPEKTQYQLQASGAGVGLALTF